MSIPRSTHPEGAVPTAPRIGRRIGIVIFWLLAAYVIGMSSISVISALYWPESAPHPAPASADACVHEIRALEQELVDNTIDYLERRDIRGMEPWLQRWDRRYLGLGGGCGSLESARKDLGILRAETEVLLERYAGHAAKRQERILQALEAWPAEPHKFSRKEFQ